MERLSHACVMQRERDRHRHADTHQQQQQQHIFTASREDKTLLI